MTQLPVPFGRSWVNPSCSYIVRGGVVEKRRRRLLAGWELVRVGLDEPATGDADQLQVAPNGGRRYSLAAEPPVDEQTGDADVGALYKALLPLRAVVDVGQLLNRPELAPGDGHPVR
jgi:hypothetical protein